MGITSDSYPDSFIQWDNNEQLDTSNAVDMLTELQNINNNINSKTIEIMNKLNEVELNDNTNTNTIISSTGYKFFQLS